MFSIYNGEFFEDLKHGPGKITYIDGGTYVGEWYCNAIVGVGKYTINCGKGNRGGPSQVSALACAYNLWNISP